MMYALKHADFLLMISKCGNSQQIFSQQRSKFHGVSAPNDTTSTFTIIFTFT